MIGFIGLGNQGEPIAARIAARLPLQVWARRPASAERLVAAGATSAASKPDLGAACDLIGICVRTDDDVRAVIIGDDDDPGVLRTMSPGSVLVIHSTVAPSTVVEIADYAQRRDVDVLDAPVSGGQRGAQAGELTVLVGGSAAALATAQPVLETFASTIAHLGAVGAGQTMKLVNNNMCFSNAVIGIAGLELAERLGLDVDEFARVISASSGASRGFDIVSDDAMLAKASGPTSNVDKDVSHLQALLSEQHIDGGQLIGLSGVAADRICQYARHRNGS